MTDLQKIWIIKDFVKYCYTQLSIKSSPEIIIINDKKFVKQNRSFGSYTPDTRVITAYLGKRNLADFLRTLGHELIHHSQAEQGLLSINSGDTGSEIENEANAKAGVLLRNYGKMNDLIYENKKSYNAQRI
jgi:Zn-dependent peptidase ImmA (M78 family)